VFNTRAGQTSGGLPLGLIPQGTDGRRGDEKTGPGGRRGGPKVGGAHVARGNGNPKRQEWKKKKRNRGRPSGAGNRPENIVSFRWGTSVGPRGFQPSALEASGPKVEHPTLRFARLCPTCEEVPLQRVVSDRRLKGHSSPCRVGGSGLLAKKNRGCAEFVFPATRRRHRAGGGVRARRRGLGVR